MIIKFIRQLFCFHDYEEVATWKFSGLVDIKYRCSKCGKEKWDTIRF